MNQGPDYGRLARLGRIVTGWPRLSIGAAVAVVVIVAMRVSERLVYYEGDDRGDAG